MKDFNEYTDDLEKTLQFLIDADLVPYVKLQSKIKTVIEQIQNTRNNKSNGKIPHQFEFDIMDWIFDFETFQNAIMAAKLITV